MTPVIVLSNRKNLYLPGCLASIREHLTGWDWLAVVDDSGDDAWRRGPDVDMVVSVGDRPCGYTQAMRTVWKYAAGDRFMLIEEDFRLLHPVDLAELHAVLDAHPQLAQVALQRGPWYPNEQRAGSVLQAQRERVDRDRAKAGRPPTVWTVHSDCVEHDAGVTCNPALWSARATEHDWPDVAWSEEAMGDQLLTAGLSSAWFGRDGDRPHVEHVGSVRAEHSTGY